MLEVFESGNVFIFQMGYWDCSRVVGDGNQLREYVNAGMHG